VISVKGLVSGSVGQGMNLFLQVISDLHLGSDNLTSNKANLQIYSFNWGFVLIELGLIHSNQFIHTFI
jgi:hypothetical protein